MIDLEEEERTNSVQSIRPGKPTQNICRTPQTEGGGTASIHPLPGSPGRGAEEEDEDRHTDELCDRQDGLGENQQEPRPRPQFQKRSKEICCSQKESYRVNK